MAPQSGTVKFYNRVKGFGFIVPDDGGKDVFIHYPEVRLAGVDLLHEGARLAFETRPGERTSNPQATNLRLLGDIPLSELPKQGLGPHFRIDDNAVLNFDSPPILDPSGNDLVRLKSLQPLIVDLTKQLLANLRPNEQPQLRAIGADYLKAVDERAEEIDYVRLYGLGLRLANSLSAARRQIADRLLPSLEDSAAEALDSLLALHGPFILSTKVGNELLADAERYERRPQEEVATQQAALALGRAMELDKSVSAPEVGRFIREVAGEARVDEHQQRAAAYSAGTMKNVAIVVIAGAVLGAIPISGGILFGPPGLVAGAVVSLLGNEGLKKARAFALLQGKISDVVDQATGVDLVEFVRKLVPLKQFVLRNEAALRQLAGDNTGLKWIHQYLDWIKSQPPDTR